MNRHSANPCQRLPVAGRGVPLNQTAPICRPQARRLRAAVTALAALALLLLCAMDASACAACFGKSDSKLAEGMNAGIFALMGVIGSVLFAIAGFFFYIIRRAATHPLPIPSETFSPVEPSNP